VHALRAASFVATVPVLTISTAMAIEEPGFQALEKDGNFELREYAPYVVACWRYSGRWTVANYRQNETLLRERIKARGLVARGDAILARYNPPFTPWFLRREEADGYIRRCLLPFAPVASPRRIS